MKNFEPELVVAVIVVVGVGFVVVVAAIVVVVVAAIVVVVVAIVVVVVAAIVVEVVAAIVVEVVAFVVVVHIVALRVMIDLKYHLHQMAYRSQIMGLISASFSSCSGCLAALLSSAL